MYTRESNLIFGLHFVTFATCYCILSCAGERTDAFVDEKSSQSSHVTQHQGFRIARFKREVRNETQKVDRATLDKHEATPPPIEESVYKYSNFEELRRSPAFVDKTLLIKHLLDPKLNPSTRLYITAPGSFGKTLNLDMLDRFLRLQRRDTGELMEHPASNQTKLFSGTKISTQENDFIHAHHGQYIVLRLSLGPLYNITTYNMFKNTLCSIISDAEWQIDWMSGKSSDEKMTSLAYYREHCRMNFLSAADILPPRLKRLSKTLGKRAVLLWDDLDILLRASIRRTLPDTKSIYKTVSRVIVRLTHSDVVRMSVAVGRLNFGGVMSSIANCTHVAFNGNAGLAPFFGLTKSEVHDLVEAYRLPLPQQIELYYNGYEVMGSDLRIYNSFSIASLVGSKKFDFYWQNQVAPLFPFTQIFATPLIGTQVAFSVFAKWISTPKDIPPSIDSVTNLQAQLEKKTPKINETLCAVFMSYLLETGYYTIGAHNRGSQMRLADLETVVPVMAQLFLSGYYERYYEYTSNAKVIFLAAVAKLSPAQSSYDRLAWAIHNLYLHSCSKLVDQRPGLLGNLVAIFSSTQAVHAGVTDVVYGKRVPLDRRKSEGHSFGSLDLMVTFGNQTSTHLGVLMELVLWKSAELAMTQLETFEYMEAFNDLPEEMRPRDVVLLGVNLDKTCKCTLRYKYGNESTGQTSFPKPPNPEK
ncbi:unnamed protein product [Bemisia tabaci]|uniref:AAA-ATPase-like domain-containing protein n=1 Tax=Bemisia tabaci TaxID=7038 RepID=A0A9P0F7B5_BEMTA|nr:unnamed protein product [Bemisia tabaci]